MPFGYTHINMSNPANTAREVESIFLTSFVIRLQYIIVISNRDNLFFCSICDIYFSLCVACICNFYCFFHIFTPI